MRYITAAILSVCFVGLAAAQVLLLPEREIVPFAEAVFSGGKPEFGKTKCGDYFLYTGAATKVPLITLNIKRLLSSGKEVHLVIMMQKRNIEVRIDNKKGVPTAEVLSGPKLILRINRADYKKAARCLPKPLSA